MNSVTFASFDVLNTSVLDSTTQQVLFEVSTPRFKLKRITTIKNAAGEVVAEYEPHFRHDTVTLNGYTTRLSEWLPKKGTLSTERLLTLPSGQVYVWKQKWSGSFKLVAVDAAKDTEPVVETHNARVFSRSHKGSMSVHGELMPYLDAILLSFIICEREYQDRSTASAAAATAATA